MTMGKDAIAAQVCANLSNLAHAKEGGVAYWEAGDFTPGNPSMREAFRAFVMEVSEAVEQYEKELNGGAGNFSKLRKFILGSEPVTPVDHLAEALMRQNLFKPHQLRDAREAAFDLIESLTGSGVTVKLKGKGPDHD